MQGSRRSENFPGTLLNEDDAARLLHGRIIGLQFNSKRDLEWASFYTP
jgi:hypothetical protein